MARGVGVQVVDLAGIDHGALDGVGGRELDLALRAVEHVSELDLDEAGLAPLRAVLEVEHAVEHPLEDDRIALADLRRLQRAGHASPPRCASGAPAAAPGCRRTPRWT